MPCCQSANFRGWNWATCPHSCFSEGGKLTDFFSCHHWNIARHSSNLLLGMIKCYWRHHVQHHLQFLQTFRCCQLAVIFAKLQQFPRCAASIVKSLENASNYYVFCFKAEPLLRSSGDCHRSWLLLGPRISRLPSDWSQICWDLPKNSDQALQGFSVNKWLKLLWARTRHHEKSQCCHCPSPRLIETLDQNHLMHSNNCRSLLISKLPKHH